MARTALSKSDALKVDTLDQKSRASRERMTQISQKTYSQLTQEDKDFLAKYILEANLLIKPE